MSHELSKYGSSDDFFNDIFDYRFPSIFNNKKNIFQFPKINVSDGDNCTVITANVPGIKSGDIAIDIDGDRLTISGHSKREKEEGKEDSDYYRFEREEGSFSRSISLPSHADKSQIDAKTKNGVLTITIPNKEGTAGQKIHIRED